MMTKVLFILLILSPTLRAKDIDPSEARYPIDFTLPTLLIFQEGANLALGSPSVDLNPLAEGENIWKLIPKSQGEVDLEFILASGKHLILKIKIEEGIKDHTLSVKEQPTLSSVEGVRARLVPLARQTFLRAVRNSPAFPKTEEVEPDSVKKFAESWKHFKTEQFLIHVGTSSQAKRSEIEGVKNPSIILIGFHEETIVVICRRKP